MTTMTRRRPVISRNALTAIIVTPSCELCGNTGSISLPLEQLEALESGALIHEAAPDLSRELREQYISGTHADCWRDAQCIVGPAESLDNQISIVGVCTGYQIVEAH